MLVGLAMTQAFEGITILDFTQVFAGPFAAMQLALLGAEVIKIEQPITGDQTRNLMSAEDEKALSPAFLAMNVNKKSLTLNLKSDQAKEIIRKLVINADVVIENFKAGTMTKLGLDYTTLKELKPDLIYCSITGYGQQGPKAGEGAYDGAIQAASGMMSQNGHNETGPTRTGFMPVDMATALNAAFSIAASLHRKATTSQGQYIDVAMLDTAIVVQAAQFSNYFNQGRTLGLMGNASPTGQPTANVFATKDGFIQITALGQNQVEKLFEALGTSEDLGRPAFTDPRSRAKNANQVHDYLAEKLKQKNTLEWLNDLASRGIPVAEIRDVPQVIADPQLQHREVFASMASPNQPDQEIKVVKAGYMALPDGPKASAAPPLLGANTRQILIELGYSESDYAELKSSGVI